ncbi:cytochrome P450 [Nocardia jiangxiensis]|uniref:Cytochrome P450 n=1 Tax=Nocardia jiangxiensis TaxID=282685 RepID=A0ABW6S120_9NOCA
MDLPFIDFADPEYLSDPVRVLQRARQQSWLARTSVFELQVLSHRIAAEMMRNRMLDGPGAEIYHGQGFTPLMSKYAREGMLPLIPEPPHDRIRNVLRRGFNPRMILGQRKMMQDLAIELVDSFSASGRCDLVSDFSHHYPITVVCRLMGIPPQDIDLFNRRTTDLSLLGRFPIDPWVSRIDAALSGLYDYFRELVRQRQEEPGEDFVSAIIEAQTVEETLTEDEMFGALVNLLFAGQDTTRFQFSWLIYQLLTHPRQWERLIADPGLAQNAIEESMRHTPSQRIVLRRAVRDVEFGDVVFRTGTLIGINTLATNMDPEVFDSPEIFDIGRSNASKQQIFGGGAHACLGQVLARVEMTEALQVFAERFPKMDIAGEVHFTPSPVLLGPEQLPLRLGTSA